MLLLFIFYLTYYVQGLPIKTIAACRLNNDIDQPENTLKLKRPTSYSPLLFDVRFVVFHDNSDGLIGQKVLEKQIDILNDGFSGGYSKKNRVDSSLTFRLGPVMYVNNAKYYNYCDTYGDKMASLYGVDNDKQITIMVCNSLNYLGWAYLPWYWPEENPLYSVFIHTRSLPDSDLLFYNQGKTIIHEIGHFFDLLHTFPKIEACVDSDYVSDTPIEKSPSWWCDESRDSCPKHEGKDPVTNFMDYSLDSCKYEFTSGQVSRMWSMIDLYKPSLKKQGISNYLSTTTSIATTKYKLYFYKLGKGVCGGGKNINIIRYKPKNKYIARHICDKKANEVKGSAYTFTKPKFVPDDLKYNCLIHFFDPQKTITSNIKLEKNSKSECYVPKETNTIPNKMVSKATTPT